MTTDTVSRPVILVAVAAAVAWIAFSALYRPTGFGPTLVLRGVDLLITVGGLALWCLFLLGRGHRPAGFVVGDGAFVVPAGRRVSTLMAGEALAVAWVGGFMLQTWPDGNDRPIWYLYVGLGAGLLVLGAVVAGTIVMVLRGVPRIELTPYCVVSREVFGTRSFPWEALRPGRTQPGHDELALTLDHPERVTRHGLWYRGNVLNLWQLQVHPGFLADAIRFYVDHPERRSAIGAAAEYERLLTELG